MSQSMKAMEVSPSGSEFQPGTQLATSLFEIPNPQVMDNQVFFLFCVCMPGKNQTVSLKHNFLGMTVRLMNYYWLEVDGTKLQGIIVHFILMKS